MPQTQPDGRHIKDQLSQAIGEMGDFLSKNPSDEKYYKILCEKIDGLTLKAKREGYFGYEHNNPHRTLTEFLNQDNTESLILKYYSNPTLTKVFVKQPRLTKVIKGGKKLIEFAADIAGRIIKPH